MRRMMIGGLIAALAFCGFALIAATVSGARDSLDGIIYLPTYLKYQKVARDALVDPDSAKFRDLYFRTYGGSLYLCGEVNSRNRMGGYTGFHPFNATSSVASFWGENSYSNDVVIVACR